MQSIQENKLHVEFKSFTQREVLDASITYFNGDELAARVWMTKYALKDSSGNLFEKTPDDMHKRLAKEIARIETKYKNPLTEKDIYEVLKNFTYIVPQGSPMSGIGNNFQVSSLSNCFVIGNNDTGDSYGGILKIDQEQVQLMKRRGGVGHDLSHIRPQGSGVKNSALTSTGIVPFMRRYSNSTREVAQDGRRGALMLSVAIKHPDAKDFIDAKMKAGKVTGANISVKVDDKFMEAVIQNKLYKQQYPINSEKPKVVKRIEAKKLWKKIVHNAWKSAEPGILFWDTIIKESVPDCYEENGYKTVSTNPCGEIPLCPYDSCRLLAINLYSYVENPFTPTSHFNFELFKKHINIAQRIMDDIIDIEVEKIDAILEKIASDPETEEIKGIEKRLWLNIRHKTIEGRRTGLGTTAEGDMLAAMNFQYGSKKAIEFSAKVHKVIAIEAYRTSVSLAKERGAFQIYDPVKEMNNPFIQRLKVADESLYKTMCKYGRRNIACLTIAPTGTTSIMTQTTSGIEPVFLPVYKRRKKINPQEKGVQVDFVDDVGDSWEEYNVFHHQLKTWMKLNGYDVNKNYTDDEIEKIIKLSPYYKATSNDINWINKIKLQGAVQKWIDHSISVTVNLPKDIPEEVVGNIYIEAWKSGCKGCTVYRGGSREGVLLSTNNELKNKPIKRPEILEADVVRFQNNKEKWIAFIGLYNGSPYEIFTGIADDEQGIFLPVNVEKGIIVKKRDIDGNSRYDFQFENKRGFKITIEGLSYKFNEEFWNYAKLISGILRYNMPIEKVVDLIKSLHLNSDNINTWRSGVERALKKYIPNGTKLKGASCKNCGANTVIYQEGCLICQNCGSSKCG